MTKVFCKSCEYYDNGFGSCNKIVDKRKLNKFNGRLEGDLKFIHLTENKSGNCKYFEQKPKSIIIRFINKIMENFYA